MKKTSLWALIALVLVAASLVVIKSVGREPASDEEQIHELLTFGQTALEQKDMKAAMSCVSHTYKDPAGTTFDQLRAQIIQFFQQEGKYDVTLENAKITINAPDAEVTADVAIAAVSHGRMHTIFSSPMTIRLTKEKTMRWLVFPAMRWKVISLEGMPSGLAE